MPGSISSSYSSFVDEIYFFVLFYMKIPGFSRYFGGWNPRIRELRACRILCHFFRRNAGKIVPILTGSPMTWQLGPPQLLGQFPGIFGEINGIKFYRPWAHGSGGSGPQGSGVLPESSYRAERKNIFHPQMNCRKRKSVLQGNVQWSPILPSPGISEYHYLVAYKWKHFFRLSYTSFPGKSGGSKPQNPGIPGSWITCTSGYARKHHWNFFGIWKIKKSFFDFKVVLAKVWIMGFPDKQYLFQDFTGESSLRQPFSPVNYTWIPAVPPSPNPATLGTISRTIFGEINRLKIYTTCAPGFRGSGHQGSGVLLKNQSRAGFPCLGGAYD